MLILPRRTAALLSFSVEKSVVMISILSSGFSSDWEGMTSSINGILAFCSVTFEHAFESGLVTVRDTVDMAATCSFVIFFIDVLSSTVTVVSLVVFATIAFVRTFLYLLVRIGDVRIDVRIGDVRNEEVDGRSP